MLWIYMFNFLCNKKMYIYYTWLWLVSWLVILALLKLEYLKWDTFQWTKWKTKKALLSLSLLYVSNIQTPCEVLFLENKNKRFIVFNK